MFNYCHDSVRQCIHRVTLRSLDVNSAQIVRGRDRGRDRAPEYSAQLVAAMSINATGPYEEYDPRDNYCVGDRMTGTIQSLIIHYRASIHSELPAISPTGCRLECRLRRSDQHADRQSPIKTHAAASTALDAKLRWLRDARPKNISRQNRLKMISSAAMPFPIRSFLAPASIAPEIALVKIKRVSATVIDGY